jgi:hypothetical protein
MTNARRRRQIRRHRFDGYPPFEHNAAVQRIKTRIRHYRAMRDAARTARRVFRDLGRTAAAAAKHFESTRQETLR